MQVNRVDAKTKFKAGLGCLDTVPTKYSQIILNNASEFVEKTKRSKLNLILEDIDKNGLIKKLQIYEDISEKGNKMSRKFKLLARYVLKKPINVKSKTLVDDLAMIYKEALSGIFPKKTTKNPLIGIANNTICKN